MEKIEPVAFGVFHEDGSAHVFQQKETADVFGTSTPLYSQEAVDQLVRERDELIGRPVPLTEWQQMERQLAATEALCQQYREYVEANEVVVSDDEIIERKAWKARLLATTTKTPALNKAIADELRRMAEGFESNDPHDSTKFQQYYGSHIRGVLHNRANELEDEK